MRISESGSFAASASLRRLSPGSQKFFAAFFQKRRPYFILLLAPLGSLAACGPAYDPQTREGLWAPVHANRANLVLQAENPSDLTFGKGSSGADGQLASAAVERLRAGKVKKLPDSNIAQVSTSGGGGSSGDSTSTSSSQ